MPTCAYLGVPALFIEDDFGSFAECGGSAAAKG